MNDTHKPDDLHDEQLSHLYRQSRIEVPPMALDSTILQRARKATEKKSWWPWLRRFWIAPLATATAVLLTVSVVIQMKQQHPEALAPAVQSELPAEQANETLHEGFANKPAPALEKRKEAAAPASAENKAQPKKELKTTEPARAFDMETRQLGNRREAAGDSMAGFAAPRSPETWLEQIQALLKAGKKDEAQAELTKFVEQNPGYPLPVELQPLLKTQATSPAK